MFDPNTPEGIACTINHGFGLLAKDDPEYIAQLKHAAQIYNHHVRPVAVKLQTALDAITELSKQKDADLGSKRRMSAHIEQLTTKIDLQDRYIRDEMPKASRSGYALVKGTSQQVEAQLRSLDLSSGFCEVILNPDMVGIPQAEAFMQAWDAVMTPKGVVAIIHHGDVELRPLAPAAVPHLEELVRTARDHLQAAFEGTVTWELGEDQTPEGLSVMACQDTLRVLLREISLAGLADFQLDIDRANPDLHDEAVAQAKRMAEALDGTGKPLMLRYGKRMSGLGVPCWNAAVLTESVGHAKRVVIGRVVIGCYGDTPTKAVTALLEALLRTVNSITPMIADLVCVVDPAALLEAVVATPIVEVEHPDGHLRPWCCSGSPHAKGVPCVDDSPRDGEDTDGNA